MQLNADRQEAHSRLNLENTDYQYADKRSKDRILNVVTILVLILISAVYLSRVILAPVMYDEIDSYALPVISIQYRGSIIMDQSDINQARVDFPRLYANVTDYDSLRSAKLPKITNEKWASYYFPVYSLVCIPAKLVLKTFHKSQERAFPLTNAFLVIAALVFLYSQLKYPIQNRLFAILFLAGSPIFLYIQYIAAETFIYSMVVIAMVCWANKWKKSAAIILSIASWPNPTIMVVGIVMIADYFIEMAHEHKDMKMFKVLIDQFWNIFKFGACFSISLLPFAFNYLTLGTLNPTIPSDNGSRYYLERLYSYYFDLNLGYFSFAPVIIILFFVLVLAAVVQKKYEALFYFFASLGTVAVFSKMIHINSGMLYCARYVIWSYPIIALFVATIGISCFQKRWLGYSFAMLGVISSILVIGINVDDGGRGYYSYSFNDISDYLLQNHPKLYNPYYATFHSRLKHIDGGYWLDYPIWYADPETGNITKILILGDESWKDYVLSSIGGSEADMSYLREELKDIPEDGEYHYINISPGSGFTLHELTLEEKELITEGNTRFLIQEAVPVSGNNELGVLSLQIDNIKPYTYYKVNIRFDNRTIESSITTNVLDFYGGPKYDSPDQDVSELIVKGKTQYTQYIYSGDPSLATDKVYARFYAVSKVPILVEQFEVIEMKHQFDMVFEDDSIISGKSELGIYQKAVELQPNTEYRIEVVFKDAFNPSELSNDELLYVDFYGNGYDNPEQQQSLIGLNKSDIKLKSGMIGKSNRPVYVRIVADTELPVIIDRVRISIG